MHSGLQQFNALRTDKATERLTHCCGAMNWVLQMRAQRPFANVEALFRAANACWWALAPADWLEAFRHHPQIGDLASLRTRFAATQAWAANEQAGTATASEAILAQLATGNAAYEQKFGYIFIVCATGKSAREMLDLLEARLPNPPEAELRIAAEEQRKITQIRLQKLLEELATPPPSTEDRSA